MYVNKYGRYFGHCPSPQAKGIQCFGSWICLRPLVENGEEKPTLTGPLKIASLYHCFLWSFLVLYDKQYLKCQLAAQNNFTVKILNSTLVLYYYFAGPSGRAVWVVGLRQLACWDCGFRSRRGSLWVLCWQVEASATSWSFVQSSPTECDASLCVI